MGKAVSWPWHDQQCFCTSSTFVPISDRLSTLTRLRGPLSWVPRFSWWTHRAISSWHEMATATSSAIFLAEAFHKNWGLSPASLGKSTLSLKQQYNIVWRINFLWIKTDGREDFKCHVLKYLVNMLWIIVWRQQFTAQWSKAGTLTWGE